MKDRVVRVYRRPWNTHVYGWIPRRSGIKDPASLRYRIRRGSSLDSGKGTPRTPISLLDLPLVNRNNRVSKTVDGGPRSRCHALPPRSVLV